MFWILFKTIIIGIIEGITEWLPISSTGHMILANEFIKLNVTDEFWEMFEVVIQLGAIMAVVILFFKDLFPWGFGKTKEDTKSTFSLWFKIVVGCIPCAIIGLLFDDYINDKFYNPWTVAIMLIVYGIAFIVIEKRNAHVRPIITKLSELPYTVALYIGLFQVLAMIPGTSRSGATILGGLLLGTSRYVAAEFTFYLAIPVMFGASALKMIKFGLHYSAMEVAILITGCLVAFFVSVFAIKFLMSYIKKHDFKVFGYYRIALGVLVLLYFIIWG